MLTTLGLESDHRSSTRSIRPLRLAASLVRAGFVALSVHVAMLASGVPFPLHEAPTWARWLNMSIIVGGILTFLSLADPTLGHSSILRRTLITFVMLVTLQETFRGAIMASVVTEGWIQPTIGLIAPLSRTLIIALLCAMASQMVRTRSSVIVAALAIALIGTVSSLVLGWALSPILRYASQFAHEDVYRFPYPFHVNVAAYATFLEAVAGATLMTVLIWDHLPKTRTTRLSVVAVLTASMKGVVGGTFVYGFFTGRTAMVGLLSWSQFLFEFLTLGILVGLAWEFFGASRRVGDAP